MSRSRHLSSREISESIFKALNPRHEDIILIKTSARDDDFMRMIIDMILDRVSGISLTVAFVDDFDDMRIVNDLEEFGWTRTQVTQSQTI